MERTEHAEEAEDTGCDERVQRTRDVLDLCMKHGFSLAGVGSIEPTSYEQFYQQWIESGKHGSMNYLERNIGTRMNPASMLDGARCAVMVADVYASRSEQPAHHTAETAGKVARYAQGRDYHKVIKRRLHAVCDELRVRYPDHQTRAFVDTAPVLERELAQRAGLGWVGKHTLLIHPKIGSRFFLGGFLTTLDLVETTHPEQIADHCGSCTRCIDACPTGAISPYTVNASRCISYLTIEQREQIAPELREKLDGWVFGCDVCMDVCPHNSPVGLGREPTTSRDEYTQARTSLALEEILGWSEDDRVRELGGSSMTRAKLGMLKRNAMLILAKSTGTNTDTNQFIETLQRIAADEAEPPLARETAQQILDRSS